MRLKILKIVMYALSVLYVFGPALYFAYAPDNFRWAPFSQPYEHFLMAVLAAFGICLAIAAGRPAANVIIVDFAILSSIFAGAAATYNALTRSGESIHLFLDVPFFYLTAIILLILYPRRRLSPRDIEAVSRDD